MRAMPAVTALLATTASQTVLRQARLGVFQGFAYSPYGWRLSSVDTAAGFNGQCLEPATGGYLLGNGHRLYNPVLMRFTRPDALSPFGKGGVNAYAYCEGDPVNRTDPTGDFFEALMAFLRPGGSTAVTLFTGAAAATAPARPVGLALGGTRVAFAGGATALTGGAMTLAGVAAGSTVAAVGGVVAGAGAAMRLAPVVQKWRAMPDRWKVLEGGVRHFFGVPQRKVPQPVIEMAIPPVGVGTGQPDVRVLMEEIRKKGGAERLI
jgi:RHS repeat-associated protein